MSFKMKKEILETFTAEVNDTVPETIRKLQEAAGPCYETDSNNYTLAFYCNKKGRFFVSNAADPTVGRSFYQRSSTAGRTAYVEGKVVEINGKTVVQGRCVFSHTFNLIRMISLVIEVMITILYVILCICNLVPFSALGMLLIIAVFGITLLVDIESSHNEVSNHASDLETMKKIVLLRIQAVERRDS